MSEHSSNDNQSPKAPGLKERLRDVFLRMYDLGFIGFGGPPVHIQIVHDRFVEGVGPSPWIDEQTAELFVIAQAFPGPGSTKLLFSIAQVHAGVLPALLAFTLWSLPGAVVMYSLSLAVQRIGATLPSPIYALLSGLNAATVGGITLSAIQLSRKAITDHLTRAIVLLAACAGLCYNALWYYPVLITLGGCATLLCDSHIALLRTLTCRFKPGISAQMPGDTTRDAGSSNAGHDSLGAVEQGETTRPALGDIARYSPSVAVGMLVLVTVFIIFVALLVLRGTLPRPPQALAVFTNMYFAGTLIIGGGPVVTPLLREYVVEPGWVSPRDFLLGLAIIQALPGPNFNFAVYLGSLALAGHERSVQTLFGAILGFLGIFSPGILLSVGVQSGWYMLRRQPAVVSLLRGMNAAAVGLIFTAVYRLWQVGYLKPGHSAGASLADEPWWLAVAAIAYTSVEWFHIPVPIAIMLGGVAGLGWWDVMN
ncbi:hypothetical protein AX17_001138 [Amanita inopinata Kibby_2008]|nr:hypothetical protein AX17_001138 [Amanita inopinata Kibby_2008]